MPQDFLVFLGDMIDRGPGSKAIIERMIEDHQDGSGSVPVRWLR